jgi:hypothetical protein
LVSKFIGFDLDQEYLKVASEVLGCGFTPVAQGQLNPAPNGR